MRLFSNLFPLTHRGYLKFAFIVYGFVSLAGQLILLRELNILFYGNELFIGFSLGAWLLWVGVGSSLGQKLESSRFPFVFLILGPIIPLEIVLTRLVKPFFGFAVTVGPLAMLSATFMILFPIGIAVGALFSTGVSFSKNRYGIESAQIYFLESLGAVVCGIVYTFLIAGRLSNFTVAISLGVLTSLASAPLSNVLERKTLFYLILVSSLFFQAFMAAADFDNLSRRIEWKGYEIARVRDSRYANLVLTRTGDLKQLFQDGSASTHFPDPQAHEELIHWPLLAHSDPQEVLLIGAGAAGELREILKHPVHKVNWLEIDPDLIPFLYPFLSPEDRAVLNDARVKIRHEDGRAYLKRTNTRYDAIILNLPEPSNAQVNRFYTQEFFKEAKTRLRGEGILALAIPSSENYLPQQIAFFNKSIYETLRTVFHHVSIIPGASLILLAHNQPLDLNPETLANRYHERFLKNIEVVPTYFALKLDPGRVESLAQELTQGKKPRLNQDFAPVSYFYLWHAWLLKFQTSRHFLGLITLVVAFILAVKLLRKKLKSILKDRGTATLFFLGFSAMVFEFLLILAFQAVLGHVYWQLGCLFASFMVGLSFGSWLAQKMCSSQPLPGKTWFFLLYMGQAAYGVFLRALLPILKNASFFLPMSLVFYFLMIPVGLTLGYGFATLSRSRPAGELYAAELWGSSLGACLTGLFLVPLAGLTDLFWFVSVALLAIGLIQSALAHKFTPG